MVEYVKGLCLGHIDYLPRLPKSILIRIIRFLPLQDVGRLARTSKQFREVSQRRVIEGGREWGGLLREGW